MPRSINDILEHADEFAARFENLDPAEVETKDASALRALGKAFRERVQSEQRLVEAVVAARADGHSWASIGAMVATSGEAARQRYGALASRS